MTIEATVLLVDSDELPARLRELLEKKSVFVEETKRAQLPNAAVAIAPDILVGSALGSDELIEALGDAAEIPILILASGQEHESLREKHGQRIAAFVPRDLPVAALAHRLATMARRSAQGQALQKTPSVVPRQASRRASPLGQETKPAIGEARQAEPARVGGPPKVETRAEPKGGLDSPSGGPSPGSSMGRGSASTGAQVKRKPTLMNKTMLGASASRRDSPTTPGSEDKRRRPEKSKQEHGPPRVQVSKSQISDTSAGGRPSAKSGGLGFDRTRAAARSSGTTKKKAGLASTSDRKAKVSPLSGGGPAPSLPPNASAPPAPSRPPARSAASASDQGLDSSVPPWTGPPTPHEKKRLQEAERLATSLRSSGAADSAVRLALIDDDMSRAGALSRELREHGVDVMLLSPEHGQAHWPVLRRFAPHGLLVDERSLSKGGRTIVGAFRRDPFLRYVPLVAVRFDRLYKPDDGSVNLHPALSLLAPLGRAELELIDKLGSGRELTVDLSEVLPVRLLEVLGSHGRATELSCTSSGERLIWPFADGKAGEAKLSNEESQESRALEAHEALKWLLEHDEPTVVVSAREREIQSGVPIRELLPQVTNALQPPPEHSVMPPALAMGKTMLGATDRRPPLAPAEPQITELDATVLASGSSAIQTRPAGPTGTVPAPPPSPDEDVVLPVSEFGGGVGRSMRRGMTSLAPAAARTRQAGRRVWATVRRGVFEAKQQLPGWAFWSLATLAPLVVLLALVVLFTVGGEPPDAAEVPPAKASTQPPLPARPAPASAGQGQQSPPEPVEAEPAKSRWVAAEDAHLPTCVQLVGEAAANEAPGKAGGYWSSARGALVRGDAEQAHEFMCRSALIEPAGPAALGLGEFYLARRSLENAEYWVEKVLAITPDERRARELKSDILNQQGKVDESRELLLDTMKLTGDEAATLEVITRKYLSDARMAQRSGDRARAERVLRRAAMLRPEDPHVATKLAALLHSRGLDEAARRWARHALERDRDFGDAHMLLGDILREEGELSEAKKHYQAVPTEHPLRPRARELLSEL